MGRMSRSKSTANTLSGESKKRNSARDKVTINLIKVVLPLGFIVLPSNFLVAQSEVEGHVLNPVSGNPVRKAEVSLRLPEPQHGYRAVTDANGHYKLSGVAPGRYQLTVERPGFAPRRRWLTLTAADSQRTLNLELYPPAAISGHVYTEDGDPLNISVQLWRETWRRGVRQLIEAGSYLADGGEYRFFGLSAGRYFVSTAQTPMLSGEAYAQTFYPSTLTLALGGEARDIDFHLRRSPTVTLSLGVVGTTNPDQYVAITLAGQDGTATLRANSNAGQFRIDGVTPGAYTLTAASEYEDRHYFARMNIDVGTLDVDGLRIELIRASEIRSTVRFEGDPPPNRSRVPVTLFPPDPALSSVTARPDDSGAYVWTNLMPGKWIVGLDSPSDSLYVKSAHVIEIGIGQNSPFEITLSSRVARLEGKVDAPDDVYAARVILIGADGHSIERNMQADPRGNFLLTGVAPGKYKLVAIEDDEDQNWRNPAILERLAAKGVAVDLVEGANLHSVLALTRMP
jgi:Carboxypeptidase regulatory-like domain